MNRRTVFGLVAGLAFVASTVCFAWAVFVAVFANGMFAAGDSHPAESADLLSPILLGVVTGGGGVLALVKRPR